jgi:nucleotide-binding universal stress UspA family protein
MKVLIGYDGSSSSRDAIEQLDRAGLPPDAQVRVVSAADVWPRSPVDGPGDQAFNSAMSLFIRNVRALNDECVSQAQTLAAEGAVLAKTRCPSWNVSNAACSGSPSHSLIQPPDFAPDLVVVGSHGRSAFGRLAMGSVSQSVRAHAFCSVRVSRRCEKPASSTGTPTRLVLGVDGSTDSALAVASIAGRTWPAGTEVKVVAALDSKFLSALIMPGSSMLASAWAWTGDDDDESWARRSVKSVARDLSAVGLVTSTLVERGNAKSLLVDVAEQWKAHCIFLGARGHGMFDRLLLGSVSAAVAARASCSVEVVRQG